MDTKTHSHTQAHTESNPFGGCKACHHRFFRLPITVPCTIVPFLSSIVTVSVDSFIKKLHSTHTHTHALHEGRREGQRYELRRTRTGIDNKNVFDVINTHCQGRKSVGRGRTRELTFSEQKQKVDTRKRERIEGRRWCGRRRV